jgi:hypothetical protein
MSPWLGWLILSDVATGIAGRNDMKSKLTGLMALVSLVLALSGGAASAETFDWSTTVESGSGTITATPDYDGAYVVTDITGTYAGNPITGLIPKHDFDGNDNELYYPVLPEQLDEDGIAFQTGSPGQLYNLRLFYDMDLGYQMDIFGYTGQQIQVDVESFVASPEVTTVTPLPAALPLFATGLGALGLLARRRKRKAALAA